MSNMSILDELTCGASIYEPTRDHSEIVECEVILSPSAALKLKELVDYFHVAGHVTTKERDYLLSRTPNEFDVETLNSVIPNTSHDTLGYDLARYQSRDPEVRG